MDERNQDGYIDKGGRTCQEVEEQLPGQKDKDGETL